MLRVAYTHKSRPTTHNHVHIYVYAQAFSVHGRAGLVLRRRVHQQSWESLPPPSHSNLLVELDWILQLRENWEIVSFFDKLVIKMQ